MHRPPSSKRNGFTNSVFFDQWAAYLYNIMLDMHDIFITGDLNFQLDTRTKPDVRRFCETLVIVWDSTSMVIPIRPSVYDMCICDTQGNPSGDPLSGNASKRARVRNKIR